MTGGSEFHYLWLLILISLIGWKELSYRKYCERMGQCGTVHYISLRINTNPKRKKENTYTFSCYLTKI
jgi:hypothetical protein